MKLRTRITLLTASVAVCVWLLTVLLIRNVVISEFRGELEKKALSITSNLADRIANQLVLGDYFQVSKAFSEVLSKEKDVEYIFVIDQDGTIVAHTFPDGHPPDLLSWNPVKENENSIALLDTEEGFIRDVAVNVFEGAQSELHVGIREDGLIETLVKMRYMTFPPILLVLFLGIIASFLLSRFITDPLNKFVEFTKVLGKGEYGKKVDVQYGDEIGYLARNFNRLSVELQTAKEKMEEAYTYTHLLQADKLSSIGQISAGLAHELKNPMTTLKMLFQAFKEQPDMTAEDAEVITNEIEKIDDILTNFMDFVKQKGFKFEETNLDELITRVLSVSTYDLEHAGITIRRDMLDGLPIIKADKALLEQVFLNLIINAVHAMPDGGEIRISGLKDEKFIDIMIWDKGIGIPSKLHSRIFDPFFTTKEQGTGLGLSIAYNIVKSHGGKLLFNSTEGKGTVFTVRLPLGERYG